MPSSNSSWLEQSLASCPIHWHAYLDRCSRSEVVLLRGLDYKPLDEDACPHHQFACLINDHEERGACQNECIVGFAFALLTIMLQSLLTGRISEAYSMLTALQHVRVMLPTGCQGYTGSRGHCEPLLQANWFDAVTGVWQNSLDFLATKELKPRPPETKRKAAGLNIAIVTAWYKVSHLWLGAKDSGESSDPPMPWYFHNKRCYAERHGYSFEFYRGPIKDEIDIHAEQDGYKYEVHWLKFAAVRNALRKGYDWIFYIDYDTLIGNFSRTLEEYIRTADSHGAAELIVQDGSQLACSNTFLLKNTAWAHRFLSDWAGFGRQVRSRGPMWEQRCFNCALVDHMIANRGDVTLRDCGESTSHVMVLRHILEKFGLNWPARLKKKVVGKILLLNTWTSLRGLVFHANNAEQARFFPQVDLYHPGDFAVHWPERDKENEAMRQFANERVELDTCERWRSPLIDHWGVYQPIGAADAPALWSPRHVVSAFLSRFTECLTLLRAGIDERIGIHEFLIAEMAAISVRFHVLFGFELSGAQISRALELSFVQASSLFSVTALDEENVYDLIYIGGTPLPLQSKCGVPVKGAFCSPNAASYGDDLLDEVYAAVLLLRPGGVLVVPVRGCGLPVLSPQDQRDRDLALDNLLQEKVVQPKWKEAKFKLIWQVTRSEFKIHPWAQRGCTWAYAMVVLHDDMYRLKQDPD